MPFGLSSVWKLEGCCMNFAPKKMPHHWTTTIVVLPFLLVWSFLLPPLYHLWLSHQNNFPVFDTAVRVFFYFHCGSKSLDLVNWTGKKDTFKSRIWLRVEVLPNNQETFGKLVQLSQKLLISYHRTVVMIVVLQAHVDAVLKSLSDVE